MPAFKSYFNSRSGYSRTRRRGTRMSYTRRWGNRPYSRYRRKKRYRKNPRGWKMGKRTTTVLRAQPIRDNALRKFVTRVGEIVLYPNQTNAQTNDKNNRCSFNCSHPTNIVHWAPNNQITTRIPNGFEKVCKSFFHCAQVGFRWSARIFNPSDALILLQIDLQAGAVNGTTTLQDKDYKLSAGTIKQVYLRPKSAINLSYNVSPLKFAGSDLDNAKLDIDNIGQVFVDDSCFLNITATEVGDSTTASAKVIMVTTTQHAIRFMEPRITHLSHKSDLPSDADLTAHLPEPLTGHNATDHTHDFSADVVNGAWSEPDTVTGTTTSPN